MSITLRKLLVSLMVLQFILWASAQDQAVRPAVISSGGGTSSGGSYSLSGTVGQSAMLVSSNGQYRLEPGFWAVVSVVEGPALVFQRAGNQVTFAWPVSEVTYVLQRSINVGNTANWQDVPQTPVQNGEQSTLSVELLQGNQFFRLRKVE